MAVLGCGGAGYIGSHTCVELIQAGYEVIVADNFINSSPEAIRRVERIVGRPVPLVKADLCNEAQVEPIFSQHPEIEAVIHFAGLKAVGESVQKPLEYYWNNLTSTLVLLRMMRINARMASKNATKPPPRKMIEQTTAANVLAVNAVTNQPLITVKTPEMR